MSPCVEAGEAGRRAPEYASTEYESSVLTSARQEQVGVVVDTSSLSGKSSDVSLATAGMMNEQRTTIFVRQEMNALHLLTDPAACESRTHSQLIQRDAQGPEITEAIESCGKRKSFKDLRHMNAQQIMTSTNEAELQQADTDCITESMHRVVLDSELSMSMKEAEYEYEEHEEEYQEEHFPSVPPPSGRYGQI